MTATRFYVGSVFVLGSIDDVTALALSQPLGWACGDYKRQARAQAPGRYLKAQLPVGDQGHW